jgi:dienelactone hydrolase
MSTSFTLPAPSGGAIHGRIDEPAAPGPRPTVVICHGFKGFMDWGFFPALAEHLAEGGFLAVRFNFSGSGMEPGEDRATDLEGFRRNTFSRELEDLDTVLAAVLGEGDSGPLAEGRVDPEALGLFGHSRGGGTALLGATRGEHAERIGALVTWAAVATYDRFDEETKATWRREGALPVLNSRTGQEMPLGIGLLEDLEKNPGRLDLESAAAEISVPWRILHGEEDESVPVEEAERLYERARAAGVPVEHERIPGTGHTFGAQHPFTGPTHELSRAMGSTRSWFRQHLT